MGKFQQSKKYYDLNKLIESISKLNNLPIKVVEHILLTEFKFLRAVIVEGEFKSVILPNFGKFVSKEYKRKIRKDNYRKKHNKELVIPIKPIVELQSKRKKKDESEVTGNLLRMEKFNMEESRDRKNS